MQIPPSTKIRSLSDRSFVYFSARKKNKQKLKGKEIKKGAEIGTKG